MKSCYFKYRPTAIYLHVCNNIEDIENQNYEYHSECDYNGTGTIEYEIIENDNTIFKYKIPVDYEEEEELDLSELNGNIIVREIHVWSSQKISAFVDEDEGDMMPASSYKGLAYDFRGVYFGDSEDDYSLELEEYIPFPDETPEVFYEYFKIENGEVVEIEY